MWVVVSSRHSFQLSCRHQFTGQHIGSALDALSAIVGKLHLPLVKLDTVTEDTEHGTCSHNIGVEALFLQCIVLRQSRLIYQIHGFLHRVFDVLVIRCKREEEMMELAMDGIRNIRNARAEMDVPPSKKAKVIIVPAEGKKSAVEATKEMFIEEMAPKIQKWVVEEYTPEIENWAVNEYAPEIGKWCIEEFAPGIQKWIVEEYATEVDNWVANKISESINESKKKSLSSIEETLTLLENIEATKPTYSRKSLITENVDEPKYIQDMPADTRVKWDMASKEVKESIQRRAKIYDFTCEGAIEKFWESINFDNIKPAKSIYEGLENIIDERERNIRASLRSWRNRK